MAVERDVTRLTNVLNYAKATGETYSGAHYPGGYQTVQVHGRSLMGQRQPAIRLAGVEFDFRGQRVVDLGCNQGAMLHHLAPEIGWGIGLDHDPKLVNVANLVRQMNGYANLSFFAFDLDQDPLGLISDFMPEERADIVFLLSVCMWVRSWKEVIRHAAGLADAMLFESNGTTEQQSEQEASIREVYSSVLIVAEQSLDDPGKRQRRLFLCRV